MKNLFAPLLVFALLASPRTVLAQLKAVIEVEGRAYQVSVIDSQEKSDARIKSFNASIEYYNNGQAVVTDGQIVFCTKIADIPAGLLNHVYGGNCKLKQEDGSTTHVTVCNALLTNAFGIEPAGKKPMTTEDLGKFTVRHCYGG